MFRAAVAAFDKCSTDPMIDSSLLFTGTFEFSKIEVKKGEAGKQRME